MARSYAREALFASVSLAMLAWTGGASAQPPAERQAANGTSVVQPIVGEKITYQSPNNPLLIGGIIAFGVAYVPSVIVAAEANTHFDNYLYIPIVGPWLDIGNRPQCGGTLQPACSSEWGRKAILVASGVVQAAGVTAVVLGLVLPGRHSELVTAKLGLEEIHMNILPAQLSADGYGLTAVGDF